METPEQRRARMTRYTRAYRARHPERVRVSRKAVYDGRKRRAMELIGGAFCVSCGCDELDFLEFNHVGGGGCEDHRTHGNTMMDRLLTGKRDPQGINVLCRVCNAIDFLARKKPDAKGRFLTRWEQFTGKQAQLDKR